MEFDPDKIPNGLYGTICSMEDVVRLTEMKKKWTTNPDVVMAIDSRITNIKHKGLG